LRPQSQALALEPRILFDGAAASAAVDQHQNDPTGTPPAPAAVDVPHATPTEGHPASEQAPSAARTLLVLDSRIENREQLVAQLPGHATVPPGSSPLATALSPPTTSTSSAKPSNNGATT
jgi:hypothetical protein